jgi:hypothetical protein
MKLHVLIGSVWSSLTAGSAVKASSLPVVIASDQLGVAAKAASLPVNIASDQLGAQAKAASLSVTLATDLVGPAAKAAALAVTMATDQPAMKVRLDGDYETVAASQTDQAMGATGATGDYLEGLLITPANTSPGAVSIKDGAGSSIPIFAGGATSVAVLDAMYVPIKMASAAGAWKVTTGASVSVIATGKFT